MPLLTLDFHPSVQGEALREDAIVSLRANRIAPKFLYVTPRQAELWREVARKHSPVPHNPEFARIYREAFAQISNLPATGDVHLVGLGCGTGAKEALLHASLAKGSRRVHFSAIDISADLVLESAEKLVTAGAVHERSLVCDLGQTNFLHEWLAHRESALPRVITFFGLVPNLEPAQVTRLLRAVLRPGDVLLANVHLAPVRGDGAENLAAAMRDVLPQYDNPETLAWLGASLENWELERRVAPPKMTIGQVEGVAAFVAETEWIAEARFEKWGQFFFSERATPLRLFSSLRYTPALFESLLGLENFRVERLAVTPCGEEGIWSIRAR